MSSAVGRTASELLSNLTDRTVPANAEGLR
jgi:hypothetical protein